MGIRTQNLDAGIIADQTLGGASNASGFGRLPTTPLTFTPPSCRRSHIFETFSTPITATNSHLNAGMGVRAAPTGATGDVNHLHTRHNSFEYHILATQTLLSPAWFPTGLDIGMDRTDNDGVEITLGCEYWTVAGASETRTNAFKFTLGTSDAFFLRVKFSIADVSGTDDCAVGFRKLEIYQANIDDYDEMAALNVILGDIKIETILNGGATTTTDTTNNWLDGETHTLQVNVSAARAVTYKIDGADPIATAAFSFDSGEVVIPFIYFLQATTSPGAVILQEFECGFQSVTGD